MDETSGSGWWNDITLERHCHVCLFYNSLDEEYRLLRTFIEEGFRQRDKGFHIIDASRRADHLRRLREFGIDVVAAEETGQLEIRLSRFSASQVIDVLRSHPVAAIGGIVHENPYFVPPEELLRELHRQPRQPAATA
jgi:DcmR-like sensory protein